MQNRQRRKKGFLFGLLLFAAVSAAGCSQKQEDKTDGATQADDKNSQLDTDTKQQGGGDEAGQQADGDESGVCEVAYNEYEDALEGNGLLFQLNKKKTAAKVTSYTDIDMTQGVCPDSISYEGKEYPVTAIAESAFESHQVLESFTLGKNISAIENSGFYACPELREINLSDALQSIGEEAFGDCSSLSKITWGTSLQTVGSNAFRACEAMTEVSLPGSISEWGIGAFTDCYGLEKCVVETGATNLGEGMFTNCEAMSEINLPDTLSVIGPEAFWGCSALEELELPESLVSIGNRAFYSTNIKKLRIPDSVTGVKIEMLEGMDSIEIVEVSKLRKAAYEEVFKNYGIKIKVYENS